MENSGFVYSHENQSELGAMMAIAPMQEKPSTSSNAGGDIVDTRSKPRGTIIHGRKPTISIVKPPKPTVSVQPVQNQKPEKKAETSKPATPSQKTVVKQGPQASGFDFKEFYQENKTAVLIGGGIGGSLLLLMLLK
ncbi:hypothetical protein [Gracilimonas sediminicola]|uniref:hypothetical protein n=1 Tax=Gracilimonas sediminicola TaxID=2952158 RepID=UPI0038D4824D